MDASAQPVPTTASLGEVSRMDASAQPVPPPPPSASPSYEDQLSPLSTSWSPSQPPLPLVSAPPEQVCACVCVCVLHYVLG